MHSLRGNLEFTKEEIQDKRAEILPIVLDSIKRVEEVEEGYILRFGSLDLEMALVTEWLVLERICNSFLRYQLTLESNNGPITLLISGPSGTKDFLQMEFSLRRWL
ncbi:MAG: hypothetical protein KUG66_01785 [Gammaproteobacteria bacterium]|nr:hypothetical protein [Gammaproteobacteria bacterium]